MKKFDITPLLPFYDRAADICRDAFRREEVAPQALLEELMDIPGLPMHCPPHHFVLPAVLCPLINALCRKLGWVKDGDLTLN